MFWLRWTILVTLTLGTAQAETIGEVLDRSQRQRLASLPLAEDASRTAVVRASFDAVRAAIPGLPPVELRVITGPTVAETLHGRIVVANESLATLPEAERRFVLAHELGHVVSQHWAAMHEVYRRWVPGEVRPEQTDPVAGQLGRAASALAHGQEFEADAFALQTLRTLGHEPGDALSAFFHLGVTQDTATHPGTRKRVAMLRQAMARAE